LRLVYFSRPFSLRYRISGSEGSERGPSEDRLAGNPGRCLEGAVLPQFQPKYKGNWHFVATYSGGTIGTTTYKSSKSAVKTVKVK
jgi:hypothetical protein